MPRYIRFSISYVLYCDDSLDRSYELCFLVYAENYIHDATLSGEFMYALRGPRLYLAGPPMFSLE